MEHLIFVAELYGVDDPASRIDALLQEFELDTRRHDTASSLSRGMRQKLAICCAFLHEPEVLLLDEPLTGLDPPGRRRMCEAISLRAQNGSAVIVSSHQLEIVERLSTRFLIIHGGREMACGTMDGIRAALDDTGGDMSLEDLFLRATGFGGGLSDALDIPDDAP
jgi:ABC-2 type transport system ATP-binding protein